MTLLFLGKLTIIISILLLAGCGGGNGGMVGKPVQQHGGEKTRPDPLATRYISMLHPQSGERLDVTYYHDGDYDSDAMDEINQLFRDRHANVVGVIDPELIDYLVDIRTRLGLPSSVVFEILSGYRTPLTNAMLKVGNGQVANESLHMRGWAVDFRIRDVNGKAIAEIAKTMQRGGVAFYPGDNHVHIDLGNIRTWAAR